MCIWISINAPSFTEAPILRALIHGSLFLLSQVDLVTCGQSLLSWCLRTLDQQVLGDSFLSSVFIAVGQTAYELEESWEEPPEAKLTSKLFDWIESEALRFIESTAFSEEVVMALCVWPRSLPDALSRVCTPERRTHALQWSIRDSLSFTPRHKLFRHADGDLEISGALLQWTENDLWNMKKNIPQSYDLAFIDAMGVARILSACGDRALSKPADILTIRREHLKLLNDNQIAPSPKPAILSHLIRLLYSRSYGEVDLAYRTLRCLLGSEDARSAAKELTKNRDDTKFLSAYPLSSTRIEHRDLSELDKLNGGENAPTQFSAWIKSASSLLTAYLSQFDSFFSHLVSILNENQTFAQELFPVLVQQCLFSDQGEIARKTISAYFTDVLLRFVDAKAAISSLTDTILYLRNFPRDNNPLASNNWLDLDFIAVARAAISSRAFTTALMFIELSYDVSHTGRTADNGILEEMLSEIYDHIQEPDGFYGFRVKDAYNSLARRYEHEQQWDGASRVHGARFEADSLRSSSLDGIISALHFRGFNKQARIMLDAVSSSQMEASSPKPISYDLGWRTATWDLPIEDRNSASDLRLYKALRAVHCERDEGALTKLCAHAMIVEVSQLGHIANEDLYELGESVQRILCLKEVNEWLNSSTVILDPSSNFANINNLFRPLKQNSRCALSVLPLHLAYHYHM